MKRSSQIRLLLLGGLSGAVLPACSNQSGDGLPPPPRLHANDDTTYPGKYYHAPYRAWFPQPYNYRDPKTGLYYHGGAWTAEPNRSVVNLSEPTPEALRGLESHVTRGGFGYSSGGHYFSS